MVPQKIKENIKSDDRIPFTPRLQLDYEAFSELRQLLSRKPRHATLQSRFACYLALHLPEVAARIDEDDFGIIHLEVAMLAKVTNEAIDRNDWVTVKRHFAFITGMLKSVGPELHDALHVSYAQYLFPDETQLATSETHQQLSAHLMTMLEKLEKYFIQSTAEGIA